MRHEGERDQLLERLDRANPVPDPSRLLTTTEEADAFSATVAHKRMHDREQRSKTRPDPRFRPATAFAIGIVVVLGVGALMLWLAPDLDPITSPDPASTATISVPDPTSPTVVTTTSEAAAGDPGAPFAIGPSFALFTEADYTEPGAVVRQDGMWYLFYRSTDWSDYFGDGGSIGWATSSDGVDWDDQGRLFGLSDVGIPYGGRSIQLGSAAVLDDGTWAVYFHTMTHGVTLSTGVIGMMTAPGPEGPWHFEPDPVLLPGPEGAWDSVGLGHPSVLQHGDGWLMFYDGHRGDTNAGRDRAIGLATSPDGRVWSKHPGPVLEPASDPDAWDSYRVMDPGVVVTDEGFVMTYVSLAPLEQPTASAAIPGDLGFGLAFSDDGLDWTRVGEPFFAHLERGFNYTGVSSLLHNGDEYVLLADLEVGSDASAYSGNMWVLRHPGSLAP